MYMLSFVFNQEDWSSLHDMFGKMVQKLELCDWDDEDHAMAGHLTVLGEYAIEQIWSVGLTLDHRTDLMGLTWDMA